MLRSLTLVPVLMVAACASGSPSDVEGPPAYLALGDSVAYGYNPLTDNAHQPQNTGYVELLGSQRGLDVANASCPGEASGGFISPDGNDNGCRDNRQLYALHVDYNGTQLAFAIDYLKKHPNTELVTIDLGANDVSKLNRMCQAQFSCVLAGITTTLLDYDKNMNYILGELRKVYDGQLVGMGIYNPYPNDSTAEWGLGKLNGEFATELAAHDGVFVDGLAAFKTASADPCADGLLVKMPDGTCDIHPTAKGHEILATAIETTLTGTVTQ
jgi:lysophospholipase L1-like esterase